MKPSLQQSNLIKPFRLSAALLLAAGLLGELCAAPLNWGSSGAGGTGTWDANTTTNWFDGALDTIWPAAPGSADDDAVFGGTAGTVTIAIGGVIANDLTFNTDGNLIQGDALTLDAALTKPILLTAPNTTNAISAVIAGTNGFNKYDSGTLTLSGGNTFYGNVSIGLEAGSGPASGTLRITRAAALGVRGNVVQADGSTNQLVVIRSDGTRLELDGSGGDITIPDHVTFVTSGPNGVVRNVAGSNTISGEIVLSTGVSDSGYISDGGSLTLAGPIHVGSSARKLKLMGTNSAVNTVSGVISNAANGAVTVVEKRGANTWQLTSSNSYSGGTILGVNISSPAVYVSDGIVRLANSDAAGTSNLVVNGGYQAGRVELTGDITVTNAVTFYGRQGPTYPAISSSGTNTLTGDVNVIANGSSLNFESQSGLLTISGNPLTGASGRSLTLLGAGTGVYAKLVTTNVSNEIRKFGNGTWILTGSNNFVNASITANGGRFIAAHPHAFGPAGKAMSFAAANTTFELATDTPVNALQIWTSSGSLATPIVGNFVGNRATAGPALTNNLSSLALGSYSRVNFTTGSNATGNAVFNFTTATLSGGISGNAVLNPTSARVSISGLVTVNGTNIPKTLVLSGDATTSGHIISGAINNSVTNTIALTKENLSDWTLGGLSSYTGATTVSNGTLRVTGAISNSTVTVVGGTVSGTGYLGGAVTISGGTLEPGVSTNLSETLTINNDLALAGTALVQIGKSGATPVNDSVVGVTNIIYGGTLIATNATGATLVAGDAFTLFNASGTVTGNFTNIVVVPAEPSLIASFNPTNGTLSFASAVVPQPTLNYTNTGGSLDFSWTGGFKLQSQTNTLNTGLGTNWSDFPGGGSSPVNVPVSQATPSVFFRLSLP